MMQLQREQLLPALADPALSAINFLNEVIDRYPRAISFAPGAPSEDLLDGIELPALIERYCSYLREDKGLSEAQVRRHLYQYGPARGHINGLIARAMLVDECISVDPRAIVVTVGAQEAMLLALRVLCPAPEDCVAVVNPSFVGIVGAAKVLGVATIAIADTSDGVNLAALEAACRQARDRGQRIRALYVAPDHANPSGSLMQRVQREQLLALAERHDFIVIEDNAYGFTAEWETRLPTLKALDQAGRVLYIGTCAKICVPGVRIGFAIADQEVIDAQGRKGLLADELTLVKSMVTVNTSPICQAIVGGMLLQHGGSLAAIARPKAELYRRQLGHLLVALERHLPRPVQAELGISWNRPSGGFFVRMQLPVIADERLLELSAREYGVLWTPMRSFYLDGQGSCELRLSCSYLRPAVIDEGVERLARFLRAVLAGPVQPLEPRTSASVEAA
ncbi:PLP-dependent aminotransferase family protein [Paucibacter sp. APW11]|uniref:PLP-dependent aminotransferase family protein n=1 Tax=Roseateles aquae TaxID=3077235 RepID=A0ABU3PHR5_9BURK|nr:PLP-dependent aminotransferase family protein [Paucibacter sp. APW11]MDT9002109.1 PLP-dependent aminotransferase family protein [Paucibacter sp. APW11]